MSADSKQLLLQQWQTLHNSHESYEQYALIIKFVAATIALVSITFSLASFVGLVLLAILWLQEGIWKTFQCRTASAIIAIEDKLALDEKTSEAYTPYLLYKQWQANRSNAKTLITEYIGNSLKPTVVYPYFPLMLVVAIF